MQRMHKIFMVVFVVFAGVKDNCDNLSYIKSELKESTGIGDNRIVENNIGSTGMSLDGSLPERQDLYNTVTEISDVWLDLLPTTSGINEQQTIDNMNSTSNRNVSSLDTISNTIDTWLPDIPCNDFIINEYQDDSIIDTSTSFTSNDDDYNKNQLLKDALLNNVDIEPDSFDLLSYVCDVRLISYRLKVQIKLRYLICVNFLTLQEGGNVLDRKNIADKGIASTSEIPGSSQAVDNNKTKLRREKKLSKSRVEAEPYSVPPLKLRLNSKTRRTSKQQVDQESADCEVSDSESHTSDYSYKELREKNNKASRKSRINKKVKETEMQRRAKDLERDNVVLKMKVEELEKLVTSMRTALLQSALKKEK